MALLPAALKTEMARGNAFMVARLDLTKNGKYSTLSTKQIGKSLIASQTNGAYEPRVKSFGTARRAGGDRQKRMQPVEASVTIFETAADRWFSSALASGADLRGCPATRYIGSPALAPASWFTEFDGILYSWQKEGDLEWSLKFRCNDLPLNSPMNRPVITSDDWPALALGTEGKRAPLAYGHFNSCGITDRGALPTINVDTTVGSQKYLVTYGAGFRILCVYKDGVRQTANWTYQTTYVGGFPWTVAVSTVDQGSSVITVDAIGLDLVGNRDAANVIYLPYQILYHALGNFIYADGNGNPANLNPLGGYPLWYGVADWSAPIDTSLFSTYVTSNGMNKVNGAPVCASLYVGDTDLTGNQLLEAYGETFQVDLFWTNGGKIGIRNDNPCTAADSLVGLPWFEEKQIADFKPAFPADDTIKRASAPYVKFETETLAHRQQIVFDGRMTGEGHEEFVFAWMMEAM